MITINVKYFAILREQRGLSEEEIETAAETARALYDELQNRHAFSLEPSRLKVVVNDAFSDWEHELKQGDTVVFIPPVAGG